MKKGILRDVYVTDVYLNVKPLLFIIPSNERFATSITTFSKAEWIPVVLDSKHVLKIPLQ